MVGKFRERENGRYREKEGERERLRKDGKYRKKTRGGIFGSYLIEVTN